MDGATVAARLDGSDLAPQPDGSFLVPITGGANVLEIWVTAPDEIGQRIYRWTTLSDAAAALGPQPTETPSPAPTATVTASATATATATTTATSTATVTVTASTTATATASVTMTATATATATSTRTVVPTATVTVRPGTSATSTPPGDDGAWIYVTPGLHRFNGRAWHTSCEPYSQTQRCRTEIWATGVERVADGYANVTGWQFNNLTYLPEMTREQWGTNPLANPGTWTSDARHWRTECDTAATGRGGCRSYITATVVEASPSADGGWVYGVRNMEVLNNIVLFRTG